MTEKETHAKHSVHFAKMHEHFRQLADCCKAMDSEAGRQMGETFQRAAADCRGMSEFHAEKCAECDKVAKSIVPDGVLGVIPSDAPRQAFRAVPRRGQPSLGANSEVREQFADILKVETE